MQIRCLGPTGVSEAGQDQPLGGPKQRLVLAHLLIRANQTVPVERLITAVWDDDPPPAARGSLQSYISHLRKALGADTITGHGQGYVLRVAPDQVDSMRFEALADRGRQLRETDATAAAAVFREALDLWHGPPFADLHDVSSLQPEITRLEELRMSVVEDRVGADLDLGRDRELIGELETLAAAYPLRERLWGQLMIALYRAGRQGDALAAYDRARSRLAEDLGVDPSPDLQALHGRVLRQDPSLRSAVGTLKGYTLIERVGEGSFGVVWRATQPGTHREVAIKAARSALANSPAFIRRFEAEAERVARIEHPHVVPLYDFWRDPDGAYLVMRFLRGGSLRDLLDQAGSPDLANALLIADQITQALAAAHHQGVVHGDVRPSNVLLDEDGNAYLSDFVIAGDGGAPPRDAPRVGADRSREQRDRGGDGTRSDVYALGVMLSQLLPDTDGAVGDVMRRATAPEADARQRDAVELLTDLRAAAATPAAAAPPVETLRHPATPTLRNPYKGLRPFTESDAPVFFGRDAIVARLLARLRDGSASARFLAVVGPSGSGKSSIVRAGLVPAVRSGALDGSDAWFVAQMMPGRRPFDELATALRGVAINPSDDLAEHLSAVGLDAAVSQILPDDGELLLVIDQFEELFTLVEDADMRQRFADALVDAVTATGSRLRVVVTLRADFYDRPLAHHGLSGLMQARTEVVGPLGPDELEQAVTGPAEQVGIGVDRALIAQVVADVGDQPGALPLLQYALTELFDGRSDATLSIGAYREIGGIAGALTRRAEAVFTGLPDQAQQATRQLFLRLVTPGEGTEDTRRRAGVADVNALAPDAMPGVLDAFGDARLLSFDRDADTRAPTVEVAHEALLREWRRLRGWIDAARDDLRIQRQLQAAAGDWTAADHDPSFLATGARLVQYEAWRRDSELTATDAELAYFDASVEHRDRTAAEETARQERERALERRSVRRLRILVAVLGLAALVAGGLTVVAVTQARRAADEALRAGREARVATARELAAAADANLDVDPERSMLLAIEAIETTRDSDGTVLREAEEALHHAVGASRIELRVPDVGGALDWSADGVFVTEGPEDTGVIDIRNATTGESVRRWRGHDDDINDVEFSDDGALLATTGDDGALRVWDTASGDKVAETVDAGVEVWSPSFSADGSLVAIESDDGRWVKVLDVAKDRVITTVTFEQPLAVAISPDGSKLAVGTEATPDISVHDVASGDELRVLRGGEDIPGAVAWSPDGRRIAGTNYDGTARIWDARTGALESTLFGHTHVVRDVGWAHDSSRLVTGSFDGTTKVWRVGEGGAQELQSLASSDTADGVVGVAFSPDGRQVIAGDSEVGAVSIWDVSTSADAEWASQPVAAGFDTAVFVDDDRVGTAESDGAIIVRDAADGSELMRIDDHASAAKTVDNLDVSPDRQLIAGAVNVDQELLASAGPAAADPAVPYSATVWDATTGAPLFTVPHDAPVSDVEVHQNLMASSDDSGRVKIAHGSADRVDVLREKRGYDIVAIALSPDGRLLAVSTIPEREVGWRVRIWDVRDGEVVKTLRTVANDLVFTRDGTRLITAHQGARAIVWDVASWERVSEFRGHSGQLFAVDVTADGATVATSGTNGTIRLSDPSTGLERLTLTGHERGVPSLAFSPDGARLASADVDGNLRIWALELDDLITIARSELTRALSDAECRQYLHLDACPSP